MLLYAVVYYRMLKCIRVCCLLFVRCFGNPLFLSLPPYTIYIYMYTHAQKHRICILAGCYCRRCCRRYFLSSSSSSVVLCHRCVGKRRCLTPSFFSCPGREAKIGKDHLRVNHSSTEHGLRSLEGSLLGNLLPKTKTLSKE